MTTCGFVSPLRREIRSDESLGEGGTLKLTEDRGERRDALGIFGRVF